MQEQYREDVVLALHDFRHEYLLFNFSDHFDSYLFEKLLNQITRQKFYFTPHFLQNFNFEGVVDELVLLKRVTFSCKMLGFEVYDKNTHLWNAWRSFKIYSC